MGIFPWLHQLISKVRTTIRRSVAAKQLQDEIQFHVEQQTAEYISAGMPPGKARSAAIRAFGNVTSLKEQAAETWGWPWFDHVVQDLRYAARQLWRSPGFASTVVLTLALGVGANLAIFQLLYGVLFAQLPIAQPAQLYSLRAVKSPFDGQWFFSYPAYVALRQATQDSAPVIARSGISEGIIQSESGSSARVRYQLVSENFFDVLGISPAIGRWFLPSDEEPGQSPQPAVLRYGYWKQYFGADRSIIGKRYVLNSISVVIVGIAPQRFSGVVTGEAPDLWLPLAAQASGRFRSWFDSLGPGSGADIDAPYMKQSSVFWLWLLARVPDKARSSAVARWTQALEPALALLADADKDTNDRERILSTRVRLVSAAIGEGTLREDYSQPLIVLMTMAGLVLLVGCVNLANLQLARFLARHREFAVRSALGASRWRLLRQLFIEDLLLALIGGILAFVVGRGASSLLLRWVSRSGPVIPLDMHMGWHLLIFGAVLLLLSLSAFSLAPAWKFTHGNLADDMKSRSNSPSTQGRIAHRWSALLLACQN